MEGRKTQIYSHQDFNLWLLEVEKITQVIETNAYAYANKQAQYERINQQLTTLTNTQLQTALNKMQALQAKKTVLRLVSLRNELQMKLHAEIKELATLNISKHDIEQEIQKLNLLSSSIHINENETTEEQAKLPVEDKSEVKLRHLCKLKLIETKIDSHARQMQHFQKKIAEIEEELTMEMPLALDFADVTVEKQLNLLAQQQQESITKLEQEAQQLASERSHLHAEVVQLELEEQQLHAEYNQLLADNKYYTDLYRQPFVMVTSIYQQLQVAFAQEESNHPEQSNMVWRLQCADFKKNLHFICQQTQATENIAREIFLQLMGLLYQFIELTNLPSELEKTLRNLLTLYPVNCAEAMKAYQELCVANAELRKSISTSQLIDDEMTEYNLTVQHFNQTIVADINGSAKVKACALTLIDEIEASKQACQVSNQELFDTRLHTLILKKAENYYCHPHSAECKSEFDSVIAHQQSGKSSVNKKIIGAALILAGAIVVAASVTVKLLSLGLAAPLTISGMVGGGLLIMSGIGLFASGMERGKAKRIRQFRSAVAKQSRVSLLNEVVETTPILT